MRAAAAVCLWLLAPAGAHAQTAEPLPSVDVLIGVHGALQIADMVTTSYALTRSDATHESNPLLRPFANDPVALSAISGAFVAAEIWSIQRVRVRHPKTATLMAAGIVGLKLWVVTHNVRVIGQFQRRQSGWRDPFTLAPPP